MNAPVVSLTGISKRFGPVQALDDVSATFKSGAITALIGENGAGKSTLLRILEGETQPDRGAIEIDGAAVTIRSPRDAHERGIRVIHQEPEIIPEFTAAENIFVGDFRTRGVSLDRQDLYRRADHLIEHMGVQDTLQPGMPCRHLGPAQRQLIEILRALRPGARLVAFDEPTSSLTRAEAERLFGLILELRANGTAIAYVSHRLGEITELADEVMVLRDGACVAVEPAEGLEEDRMVQLMVGRPLADLFTHPSRTIGDEVLRMEGVTTAKVRGIDLSVRAGEVVGIGGLVGAGRSDVAMAVFGMDTIEDGEMHYQGEPYRPRSPADAIRAGIGIVPEDRKEQALLMLQSIRKNVTLAASPIISRYGVIDDRTDARISDKAIRDLGIRTPSNRQEVAKLSGGNQQKTVFARWEVVKPQLLILDEPTRGVDVGSKAEIYRQIESMSAAGVAIILISSEMTELIGLSDRIVVMANNAIVGTLAGDDATEEAILSLSMNKEAAS